MKKLTLKSWVVKLLSAIICGYLFFISLTIDSLGNKTYNIIFCVWGLLAIVSNIILTKYTEIFEKF
jgi:hypothetical protein